MRSRSGIVSRAHAAWSLRIRGWDWEITAKAVESLRRALVDSTEELYQWTCCQLDQRDRELSRRCSQVDRFEDAFGVVIADSRAVFRGHRDSAGMSPLCP